MILQQKAKKYGDDHLNHPKSELMVPVSIKEAYMAGADEVIEKVKNWFRTCGLFQIPEDNEILSNLIHSIKYE